MGLVQEVRVNSRSIDAFADVLGRDRVEDVRSLAGHLQSRLRGRVIWNVNSTAAGGGVAEMLHTLLSYARGLGVDTRWLVIGGNTDFFRITKRIHNALHGEEGDGSSLDAAATEAYEWVSSVNATELEDHIRTEDLVILHDPQTAGLIPHLVRRGVGVLWRCHIGNDEPTEQGDLAWAFLEPYLVKSHAFVFSRFSYIPDCLYHGRCLVTPPSIDPFSPKNQEMDDATAQSILVHAGLLAGPSSGAPRTFTRSDGTTAPVERMATVIREGNPPNASTPLVVQVSRWDRLKDPVGVLNGFLRAVDAGGAGNADLMLVGPSVEAVADDPEGAVVYEEVTARWNELSDELRTRVHLVTLPMDDLEENAAMVNAIQRHAAVVVQKSLREGFGLTVTEAMWKSKPVIASAVGGISDQIEHGVSGLLLKSPHDLDAFAGAITQVLSNEGFAERLGRNARHRVCQNYLGLGIIDHYDDLLERLEREIAVPA